MGLMLLRSPSHVSVVLLVSFVLPLPLLPAQPPTVALLEPTLQVVQQVALLAQLDFLVQTQRDSSRYLALLVLIHWEMQRFAPFALLAHFALTLFQFLRIALLLHTVLAML